MDCETVQKIGAVPYHTWVKFRFSIVQVHLLRLWNHRIRQGSLICWSSADHSFNSDFLTRSILRWAVTGSWRQSSCVLLCFGLIHINSLVHHIWRKLYKTYGSLCKSDHTVCKSMAHAHTSQFWNQFVLFHSCNCMHFVLKFFKTNEILTSPVRGRGLFRNVTDRKLVTGTKWKNDFCNTNINL